MNVFGLIGYPLTHSFSKKYFTGKFLQEGITDTVYELFPLPEIELLPKLIASQPNLRGLNVTIPHKQIVLPYLTRIDPAAEKIGAVNVIKIAADGTTTGYNSDYFGFKETLTDWFIRIHGTNGRATLEQTKALILGTGGASKAVKTALDDLQIESLFVSRTPASGQLAYDSLDEKVLQEYRLLINTTPLGTSPAIETFPPIPYQFLTPANYLYDLVYNPEETTFMKKGKERNAQVLNGLPMLYSQAEKSWEIWNS
ncbi:shikimate dehydrogenase [Rhodocytophaga aerolata]|uniref:Shikimate dehydrogenase n=1 Tax=Rhodocytophaga aerolata TaxID=455078 RepID=A0ABT8R0I4_9BACT|nr:shikimate dehydrogenase [Rhodocytophaga aerolata]MDO1445596.1 shikimate dehydrogenase [Rhodocytophaga aerolata]